MIIQNNLYPTAFGAYYDTENAVRCITNKGKRMAERLNFVIEINRLKKSEAKEVMRNKSLIEKYAHDAIERIRKEYPGFDKLIKEVEVSSEEKVPMVIEKIKQCCGDNLEITHRGGRSFIA